MKKTGLKDIKRRNRQVILQAILQSGGLSRVEIAEKTELAVSTVSTLIGELLEEGFLVESGKQILTAGRSRIELTINPKYGRIAVIDVGRKEVCMTMFDMALQRLEDRILSNHFLSGNDLYEAIVQELTSMDAESPLVGMGLLFQEDMQENDFRVMYSTGAESASITLKEALMSLFRVPIIEEYSQVYTVTQAMKDSIDLAAKNNAHINIGTSVFATVTIEGRTLPLRGDSCKLVSGLIDAGEKASDANNSFMMQIGNLIAVLCSLFSLESIFISGMEPEKEAASRELWNGVLQKLLLSKTPDIRFIQMKENRPSRKIFAGKIRTEVILSKG